MVSKILKFGKQKGSPMILRANGQGGSSATVLAAHFAKQNTKFGGGGKARAGKKSFPPTPFLFARPRANLFQNSASGFSWKKVRISSAFGAKLYVASLLPRRLAPRQADCIVFASSICQKG